MLWLCDSDIVLENHSEHAGAYWTNDKGLFSYNIIVVVTEYQTIDNVDAVEITMWMWTGGFNITM